MNIKNLLIVGAGDHGQVVYDIATSMEIFDKISFLDDSSDSKFVIGQTNEYEKYSNEYNYIFVAIGDNELRMKYLDELKNTNYIIPNIISKRTYLSKEIEIGRGNLIEPGSIINTNVKIGDGCIVGLGVIIEHNAIIKNCVLLRPRVIVKPGSIIEEKIYVDYGKIVG